MRKLLLTLITFIGIHQQIILAQGTILTAGDIAIINFQSDTPDAFSFITFVPLVSGTTIYFTDCGVINGTASFLNPCHEGAVVFVASSAVPAGTSFRWEGTPSTNGDPEFSLFPAAADIGLNSTGMELATAGDQIFAFQDADGTGGTDPSRNPNFIFGLQAASTLWTGDPNVANQTGLPTTLVDGVSAIAVGAGTGVQDEVDNAVFNGVGYPFADIAAAKSAILNPANWIAANTISEEPYATTVNGIYGQALPVEFTNFSGYAKADVIELVWTTASEKNNSYFSIERSLDKTKFESIGTLKGAGSSFEEQHYKWIDRAAFSGVAYYRLKQVDIDGSFDYSKIIAISFGNTSNQIKIFPNPVVDQLNLQIPNLKKFRSTDEVRLSIYSTTSHLMKEIALGDDFRGTANFTLDGLPSGMYILYLRINNRNYFRKFVLDPGD